MPQARFVLELQLEIGQMVDCSLRLDFVELSQGSRLGHVIACHAHCQDEHTSCHKLGSFLSCRRSKPG